MRALIVLVAKGTGAFLLLTVKAMGFVIISMAVDIGLLIYGSAIFEPESTFTERMTLFLVLMIFFREPKPK